MSDSPGLVDFAIGLMSSVLKLYDGKVTFFRELKSQKNCNITCSLKIVFHVSRNDFWASTCKLSLPECQDVKLTFFVPCLNLAYEVKLAVVVNVLFKLVRIFYKTKENKWCHSKFNSYCLQYMSGLEIKAKTSVIFLSKTQILLDLLQVEGIYK